MPYNAFISYSHAADGKLAPAVQSGLHRFAKPWYRLRALRVFRDKTSLSATPELWGSIEEALRTSEYFVLLASPEAAESEWVQKEVQWWLDNRSADKLLVCLTAGQVLWDNEANDFDWSQTTALPPPLKRAFAQEPLYADLSWVSHDDHLSRHEPRFKEVITLLAATIHGRPLDEMAGEDVLQHRRTRLVASAAVVAILAFALLAEVQRQVAVEERDTAIGLLGQLNVNNGLQLAKEGDGYGALSWFVQALRRDHDNSARANHHRVRLGLYAHVLPKLLHSWQQEQPVTDAEFSPDGRWLVTASGVSYPRIGTETVGEARVWDAVTGVPVSPPLRHGATVYSACFSPDGTRVLTASGDGSARIWDAQTGELLVDTIQPGRTVRLARFSPDGETVATAGAVARVWDARTGEPITEPLELPDHSTWHVAFSSDGSKLLATYGSGYLESGAAARVWDAVTGEPLTPVIRRNGKWVYFGAFSPDGKRFVLADAGGEAQVYETETGEPRGEAFEHAGRVTYAVFDPDGNDLISSGWDGVVHIRPSQGRRRPDKERQLVFSGQIRQAALSPDGRLLVTGSSSGRARVWDIDTGAPVSPELRLSHTDYPGPPLVEIGETPGPEFAVAFAPDGRRLVTTGWDGTVRIWDLASTGITALTQPEASTILPSPVAPASPRVSVERDGDVVVVTEVVSGRQMRLPVEEPERTSEGYSRESIQFTYSDDDKWLAIANTTVLTPGWLFVTETASFAPRRIDIEHPGTISKLFFGPREQRIFVVLGSDFFVKGHTLADKDYSDVTPGYLRAWDLASGEASTAPFEDSSLVKSVRFDADGKSLIGTWDTGLRIWNARTGEAQGPVMLHDKNINLIEFSADGKYIATGSQDNTARVWDAATGEPVTPPLRHGLAPKSSFTFAFGVMALGFSADASMLAVAGSDGMVRIWNIATAQPMGPKLPIGFVGSNLSFDAEKNELVVAGAGDAECRVDVTPIAGTLDQLASLTQALSTREFDATDVLVDLSSQRVTELVTRVNAMSELRTVPTSAQVLYWHQIRASMARRHGHDKHSIQFHMDQVRAVEQDEPAEHVQGAKERGVDE